MVSDAVSPGITRHPLGRTLTCPPRGRAAGLTYDHGDDAVSELLTHKECGFSGTPRPRLPVREADRPRTGTTLRKEPAT
jgi:hypothetical protein